MKGIDAELVFSTESTMLHQHIIQASNLAHARHEDEYSRGIGCVGLVLETYPLKQSYDEVVRDQALVQQVDGSDRFRRVTFPKGDVLLLTRLLVIIFACGGVFCPFPSLVAIELIST